MNNAPAVTRYTTSLKVLWMNKLLLDFRLPLRSTPLPCLDCSRDLWPGNLRRHKPSIMVLAKLEKRAYRSWKRWLCDLPLDVLNLLIYFSQDSSAGCVTSCVSPTAPRTRWSSSRPLGTRTPAPSQASSELLKESKKFIMLLLAIWLTFKTKSAFRKYLLPTSLVRVNSVWW